jgi:uncharacterized iron-regulated membrane protein
VIPLFRRILFWSHLVSGVTAGVVVLVMSMTGVLLTYQRQLQLWSDTRHFQAAPAPGQMRLPSAAIFAAAAAEGNAAVPTTLTVRSDAAAPVALALGTKTVYLNPYTAQVYGEGTGARLRAFFAEVVVWHRYLAMSGDSRPAGKAITGAANLLFLLLVLTGMYLWWPRSLGWTQVRNVVWFRRRLPGKARDFNWHNVLGFWSALPLAIVVYSGVVISYPWASNGVYRLMGEAPPVAAGGRVAQSPGEISRAGREAVSPTSGARQAVDRATEAFGTAAAVDRALAVAIGWEPNWKILTVRLPTRAGSPLTVMVDRGDGGQPQARATLTYDTQTMGVTGWESFADQTRGRRLRTILRFAHTGEVAGLIGQTMAGVVSAAASVLVYTGLALSLRRFLAWRRRRSSELTGAISS